MCTLKISLVILFMQIVGGVRAQQVPYEIYDASPGVILHSSRGGIDIKDPVIGEKVFNKDFFEIKDRRYYVRLKEVRSGEIYSFSGEKGRIYPKQIVSRQRCDSFSKFKSFLKTILSDLGIVNAPPTNYECVIHKGRKHYSDSISYIIAAQVKRIIKDSLYFGGVNVKKKYLKNYDSFNYLVENMDSVNYEFCIYTVDSDGSVYNHNKIVIEAEKGEMRSDEIVFIPLPSKTSVDLSYFTMASKGSHSQKTCYVILFKPNTIYKKTINGKYYNDVKWSDIVKELKYKGDVDRVIYVE